MLAGLKCERGFEILVCICICMLPSVFRLQYSIFDLGFYLSSSSISHISHFTLILAKYQASKLPSLNHYKSNSHHTSGLIASSPHSLPNHSFKRKTKLPFAIFKLLLSHISIFLPTPFPLIRTPLVGLNILYLGSRLLGC